MRGMNTLSRLIVGCSLFLFAACGKQPAPIAPVAGSPAPKVPAAAAEVGAPVLAQLAKADAKDGKVDQTVHKCAGCMLGMDGKAEFPLKVGGYTMHFCKQACLDGFKGDPSAAILALKIPD